MALCTVAGRAVAREDCVYNQSRRRGIANKFEGFQPEPAQAVIMRRLTLAFGDQNCRGTRYIRFSTCKDTPDARHVTFSSGQYLIAAHVDAKLDQTGLNTRLLQSIYGVS